MAEPIEVLRTPEERFESLPDFAFQPRYLDELAGFQQLRMHYIDEGPRQSEHTFLCLHGQPTWSYLYRRMIPIFTNSGGRVVAPDLFGFGRSDKPTDDTWYTFTRHRNSLLSFIAALDLNHITLVCQDWGGILGLTLPLEFPERFDRLIVMNTAFATGRHPLGTGFEEWRAWVNAHPDLNVGALMGRACPHLSRAETGAYEAPYPSRKYKAGARRFPNLVCDRPDADGASISRQAVHWWRESWKGRSFMAIGMRDPVIPPASMFRLREVIFRCPEPLELPDAGHFVQEWGGSVAEAALRSFEQ